MSIVVVTLVATACSSSSKTTAHQAAANPSSSPAAVTTVTRTFAPYAADGTLTAAVSSHLSGSCWTSSIALPSDHTYRCLASNQILDPCFAPTSTPTRATTAPSAVACFANPWTPGVELTLTQALPTTQAGTRSTPWAVQLVDGTRCVVLTGTVDQVGSLDLEYQCGTTGEAGLVGPASAGGALHVEYRANAAQPLQDVAVAVVWRG